MSRAEAQSWRHVLPFLVALGAFALLALYNHLRGFELWRNYALSGVLLGGLATWAVWWTDVRVPHYIQWVINAGLALHYVGGSVGSPDPFRMGLLGAHGINGAYHVIDSWDNVTHGVGIGAGAMGCAYLLELYQVRRGIRWTGSEVGLLAFLAGMAAGVGVELYEYLGKAAFQTIDQGGYANTMADLQFNALGAGIGVLVAVAFNRTRFWSRIQAQWGPPPDVPVSAVSGALRIPSGMAGFITFVTVPALASLWLAIRFTVEGPASDDLAAYDPALQTLLLSAAGGTMLAPVASIVMQVWRRRRGASA